MGAARSGAGEKIIARKDLQSQSPRRLYSILFNASANKATFQTYDNGVSYSANSTTSVNDGKWHHIVGVRDSFTNQVRIYINGVLENTTTITTTINTDNTGTLTFGKYTDSWAAYFPGSIDEVKIYNYARTQKQIIEDMNAGHPAVGSPIGSALAHYKFDEGYGTTVHNEGNGGSTLNGTLGAGSSAPTWTNDGKYGKALSFDGSNDYVSYGNNSSLQMTSELTVSAWFIGNTTSATTYGPITVRGGAVDGGFSVAIRYTDSNHIWIFRNGGSSYFDTDIAPQMNTWNHIIVTKDKFSSLKESGLI